MDGSERREKLVKQAIRHALSRAKQAGQKGILDTGYTRRGIANPRYQEICLTLAVAAKLRVALPKDAKVVDVESSASRAINGWFSLLEGNGALRQIPGKKDDILSTAYGAYAVTRTLILLGDLVPGLIRDRARRMLKKVGRFLASHNPPPGLETWSVHFAALAALGTWTNDQKVITKVESARKEAFAVIEKALDDEQNRSLDAGVLALTLAFLVMEARNPSEEEIAIWARMVARCRRSLLPNGMFGGGVEACIACMPLVAGFEMVAEYVPEAMELVQGLDAGWDNQWYDAMLDTGIPNLTPLVYLTQFGLAARRDWEERRENEYHELKTEQPSDQILSLTNWTIHLSSGAGIGWMYHHPSGSARVFGSAASLSTMEGPWALGKDTMFQPTLASMLHVSTRDPWSCEGEMNAVPIPLEPPVPALSGYPLMLDRRDDTATRLFPPARSQASKSSEKLAYKREIEMKDGALTIETFVPGRVTHRLPVIWPGGIFGTIQAGAIDQSAEKPLQIKKVREITLLGGPWPTWKVRFDRPVDLMYEPIIAPVATHPVRYFSAATGIFDIIAKDRLHMAWRVIDDKQSTVSETPGDDISQEPADESKAGE